MAKLFRVSTIPLSLNVLLKGQLKYLNQHFEVTAISGDDHNLDEVKDREGVKTYAIEMQRQISPFNDLISLIKLYRYFRKEKPDIVHSITPKAGLLSMVAAKLAGVPNRLHTFTGLIFPNKKGLTQIVLILMDKLLCICATKIYPEGLGVKRDLENFRITNKSLEIIGNGNVNGIDIDYFSNNDIEESTLVSLKNQLDITPKDFVLLFVGRLVKDKGINELISAFKMLKETLKDEDFIDKEFVKDNIKLLLVGPLEEDLDPLDIETIKEINENNDIMSVGFQSDVRHYFLISDLFVFPSFREGFPNVLLQAGAMGIPSLVTNINGSNEIIIDNYNGVIIQPKNSNELFLGMKQILTNFKLYLTLKSNSRNNIIEKYDKEKLWAEILKQYKSL